MLEWVGALISLPQEDGTDLLFRFDLAVGEEVGWTRVRTIPGFELDSRKVGFAEVLAELPVQSQPEAWAAQGVAVWALERERRELIAGRTDEPELALDLEGIETALVELSDQLATQVRSKNLAVVWPTALPRHPVPVERFAKPVPRSGLLSVSELLETAGEHHDLFRVGQALKDARLLTEPEHPLGGEAGLVDLPLIIGFELFNAEGKRAVLTVHFAESVDWPTVRLVEALIQSHACAYDLHYGFLADERAGPSTSTGGVRPRIRRAATLPPADR